MITLEINNQAKVRFNQKHLKAIARRAERVLRIKPGSRVSLALVANQEMKKLNRLYRGLNQTTDVLSFGQSRQKLPVSQADRGYLGEIVISYPVAKKQAQENQISLMAELARLLAHGLLHLTGHHHSTAKMAKANQRLAEQICLFDKS
ncbi:MAG: rRNA maturation RNase YbeY [bacterium]